MKFLEKSSSKEKLYYIDFIASIHPINVSIDAKELSRQCNKYTMCAPDVISI